MASSNQVRVYDPQKASGWFEYRRQRLLKDLEAAARLLEVEALSEHEYQLIALDALLGWRRMLGERIPRQRDGRTFRGIDFAAELEVLIRGPGSDIGEVNAAGVHALYGPYRALSVYLHSVNRQLPSEPLAEGWEVPWRHSTTETLADAKWKLSRWQRGESAVNAWLAARKERVPELFNVYSAMIGFVVGVLVTLFIKK